MTRAHYQKGGNYQRAVVLHSTAGRYPGDYNWLRQGGSSAAPVSCHYYIDKQGTISQMVSDEDVAWHAGVSTWVIDGQQVPSRIGLNPYSIGIELENLNDGYDLYSDAQYDACLWLTRKLITDYDIPRSQLVRHLDIAPGRKTDPAGFPWEWLLIDMYGYGVSPTPAPEPDHRAPHWYSIAAGTANIRYQPQVTADNIAAQLQAGRIHIAEWLPEEDPEYGGRWGRLSLGGFVHSTGVEAE
jgi:N-acetyl-anhydromuramyl-L-alanine amidase AmpD